MNILKNLKFRTNFNHFVDWCRFHIDTFPIMDYQPLPWLGKTKARRGKGVIERYHAISDYLVKENIECKSMLDIGTNVGYFTVQFGMQGKDVFAVEMNNRFYRTACYAKTKLKLDNIHLINMTITPKNVSLLPKIDVCLFLSVWHHLVRKHGLDDASEFLRILFEKTNKTIFFETGESEMSAKYGLPDFQPNAKEYLINYLSSTCKYSNIEHIGLYDAYSDDGKQVQRNLFAINKKS